jgi:crossover junction endodeoxyribonuclease RusA
VTTPSEEPRDGVQFTRGRAVAFVAFGAAKAQGSQESRYVPSLGRAVSHEKRPVLDWRRSVASQAAQALPAAWSLIDGPCVLDVTVYRPRPKSAPGRVFPATAPDADKLLRAIGDALTGIVYRDDAQIVTATLRKRFGEPARAAIEVVELIETRPTRRGRR